MPIVKCNASKATPEKGIAYILDPEKVVAKGSINVYSEEPEKMAQQMLQTMHIHRKGFDREERKYYHVKVAFDPTDRPENGGALTTEKANAYAAAYAMKTWPDREVVWAVQDHGASIHIHFIVGACSMETGKKLDARDADYRMWKDRAQELAKNYGLSALDWREATRKKRMRENYKAAPVEETFAEMGLKERGKVAWKDELRSIIDKAAVRCCTMDEFRTALIERGVVLTRCTDHTISYKLGEHRACRGDTLGGDYTMFAIQDALNHNARDNLPTSQGKAVLDDLLSADLNSREVSGAERNAYREFGRVAGMIRAEVDDLCDKAAKATWEEKQEVWAYCQRIRNEFWENWKKKNQEISAELSEAYKRRREAKKYEWILDPCNRRSSLLGVLVAIMYFNRHASASMIDQRIKILRQAQERLRKEASVFKGKSDEAVATLRQKGLSLDAYVSAVEQMQKKAEKKVVDLSSMTEEERFRYYIEQIKANAKRVQAMERQRASQMKYKRIDRSSYR